MKLIEPRVAAAVARRLTGDAALNASYLMERLERDLNEAVPRAEVLVADASGIPPPPPVRWALIDRARWAEANIESMTRMLAPLAERVAHKLEALPVPARIGQRMLVSVEVGALLGFVSRRVLGQYDVLVPEESAGGAPLYFVGSNLVETERLHNFVPQEFALWVAVHEMTHRFQFAGVPWLKPRFFELLETYMGVIDLDPRGLARRLGEAVRRLRDPSLPAEERSPAYLLATGEQRAALDGLQALMAVVEGHGNYVMDWVGAREIPSFPRMRRVFQHRREEVNGVQRIVNYLMGIEMKMRQYELGQAFCEEVASKGGPSALGRLWDSPEAFPTMSELRAPETWLARVA